MAAILVVMLMISGIGQVTGFTYRFIEPIKAWAIHKAMALALVASLIIHVTFVFFDHFVIFSLPQVLVPFMSHYNNGTRLLGLALGSLAISFGIFAAYGILAIVASSLGWIDSKQKAWRWIHYASYPVATLVFLHVLYSGTDVKYGTFRLAWIALGFVVVAGIVSRLRRAGTLKANK
jgi:predicted ferric reductase